MKKRSLIFGAVAASCALSVALPRSAWAAVSDEDFNALKKAVQQLGGKVQDLEQVHQRDQQTHQQDQQKIQQLQQQVGETQQLATNAVLKAEAAAQVQPVAPIPPGRNATHNFTMVGDAEVQYGKFGAQPGVPGSQHGGFALADFAPIFLYRVNDNILFEAGFDTGLANDGSTAFDLSFATVDYAVNDYMTVVAGDMVLPLGTYNERSAGWLNKFPDAPLMYQGVVPNVGTVLPGSGVGVQLRGSLPVGDRGQMLTYAVYGVNGPVANYDQNGAFAGMALDGGNVVYPDLNAAPAAGGRIGWFIPFKPHYDLEIGVSGQSGVRSSYANPAAPMGPAAGNLQWSAFVVDAALHLSPYVEIKGEYMNTWVESSDLGGIQPSGWWLQAGYKLAGLNLDLPLINNMEPVFRYDTVNDGLGHRMDRYSTGLVYYFTNTLLFEADYEFYHNLPLGIDPATGQAIAGIDGPQFGSGQGFLLQLSYGF